MNEQLLKERNGYENAKAAAGYAVADNAFQGAQTGVCAPAETTGSGLLGKNRSYTLAEEAEKGMRHHAESHGRLSAAHDFLSRHPEFDEFVRLVRSGSIQF